MTLDLDLGEVVPAGFLQTSGVVASMKAVDDIRRFSQLTKHRAWRFAGPIAHEAGQVTGVVVDDVVEGAHST